MQDIDYSRYHAERIIVTERGHAFIYWCSRKLAARSDWNYGKGQMHWFEYLGKENKDALKQQYPQASIQEMSDPRVNKYLRARVRELEKQVCDTPY